MITNAGLPTEPPDFPRNSYLKAMEVDKKVIGGELRFALVEKIGRVRIEKVRLEEYDEYRRT